MLYGKVIPPVGGQTEFADMRAAWDALPEETQQQISDLVCEHSLLFSRAVLGFADFTEAERATYAPVRQRLVRRHAGSGRRSIFLSSHIGGIVGWQVPEALALLRDLTEHATQREFVYTHQWRVNDLVLWDNRCTMHRGRAYDDQRHPRDMQRVTLEDSASTLDQPA
jgi:alpha-ketoglutarate-dependent 2,4-dichlorophenoxyacetate dioxygenase